MPMAYCGQPNPLDYFNFNSSAEAPVKIVVCGFTEAGAGIPPVVLSLLVFAPLGMAVAYRVKHPSPLLVAGMLVAGVAVTSGAAPAVNIFALVLFGGISALGLYLYARAQSSL